MDSNAKTQLSFIKIRCHKCAEEKKLKEFDTNNKNTHRFNKSYECKRCRRIRQREKKLKDKDQAALDFWQFHSQQMEYYELVLNGFGDFENLPANEEVPLATYYFFLQLHEKSYDRYRDAFHHLYKARIGEFLTIRKKTYVLRRMDDPVYMFNIYLRCKACNRWLRTYKQEPVECFALRDFKVTEDNYRRNKHLKCGWEPICKECG